MISCVDRVSGGCGVGTPGVVPALALAGADSDLPDIRPRQGADGGGVSQATPDLLLAFVTAVAKSLLKPTPLNGRQPFHQG